MIKVSVVLYCHFFRELIGENYNMTFSDLITVQLSVLSIYSDLFL